MGPPLKKKWLLILALLIVVTLGILESVDQWQGGPLGRENDGGGGIEGVITVVGKHIWFGGDILENPTRLPINILSVDPMNHPYGLDITTGVMMNTSEGGAFIDSNNEKDYVFVHEPVQIPGGESIKSKNRYFTAMVVVPQQIGTYEINGLIVQYHWGPFTYAAKLKSLKFHINVKSSS